ncbi:MAG: hypothetical protein JRJ11_05810, partial [Deltaproteobacteria bacterium]|nr:hypothetical protein [Deltaproteobacteria bacterium]
MIVDENDFFRKATLRICGHLDIEIAMSSCLKYIESFMPAETMYLQLYELNLGAMRVIAKATAKGGEKIDVLTPFPPEAKDSLAMKRADYEKSEIPNVMIFNHPEADPISSTMLESLGETKDSSILVMPLVMED